MQINEWTETPNSLLDNHATMRLVSGQQVTVCKFDFSEPDDIPTHIHENEQITFVLKGKLLLNVAGEETILSPGDIHIIAPNIKHSASILEVPFQSIDIFSPVRTDFLHDINAKASVPGI